CILSPAQSFASVVASGGRRTGRRAGPERRKLMSEAHQLDQDWQPSPNNLESFWLPFTPNRSFKKKPRLIARARDMHYFALGGQPVLDGTAGLWCCNAGHCREPIVRAIQDEAATLDYAPAFQFAHPKAFELASRLTLMAPGDLDYCFFTNS